MHLNQYLVIVNCIYSICVLYYDYPKGTGQKRSSKKKGF